MSGKKYYVVKPGELRVTGRYLDLACCDCGLVHTIKFRLKKKGAKTLITRRTWRNERATAAMRRGKRYKGLILPNAM